MLASRQPKKSLSKNLLQMKFMQRQKEEYNKEEEEKQYKIKLTEEHWYIDNPGLDDQIRKPQETEPSFVVCENLLPTGRMSFKNFNPTIEKINAEILRKRKMSKNVIKDDEQDISDDEMAKRYESLVDTVGKKFARKRKTKESSDSSDSGEEHKQQNKKKRHKIGFRKPKLD